ncbi:glycosyltransferase family 39 protein [Kitasatospora sp. NPDC050543]|uniref:glycosyltransferase family 39 protein n=1 Tax=Kitasatospora sp. NPDC050543 TaxID=3364054 RepID=UPI0037B64B3E
MTPAVPFRSARRLLGAVWFWPALAMFFVGVYRLSGPELWRDEVSSWSAATRGLGDLLRMLQHVDASNGAYYVVLHGWTELFGDSPAALRLPSVLAMAGAAAFTALTAQRMFDSRVAAVAAGLLLATVPNISRYAQEARSYALVTCAVAASTWLLLRALDRPGIGRWAAYSGCLAAAGVAHLISFSTVGGQLALVLLHLWRTRAARQRRLLWQYPLAVVAALVPAAPVIVLGGRQSERQLGWIPAPTLYRLRTFGDQLFGSPAVLYGFLALAVLALAWPGRRLASVQLLLLATVPVAVVWLASHGGTSYFIDRYLLFTLPAWAALAGGGVAALHAFSRRWAPAPLCAALAVAVVAASAVLSAPAQREVRTVDSHEPDEDYRGAAALVAAGYRPGDGLAASGGESSWAMVGPGVSYYLPDRVRPYPVFVARSAAHAADLYPVECPAAAECLGHGDRIWLVTLGTDEDQFQSLAPDQVRALRGGYTASEVRRIRGITVTLLTRTGA